MLGESQFALGMWSLVVRLSLGGCSPTHVCMSSTNWTLGYLKKNSIKLGGGMKLDLEGVRERGYDQNYYLHVLHSP